MMQISDKNLTNAVFHDIILRGCVRNYTNMLLRARHADKRLQIVLLGKGIENHGTQNENLFSENR